MPTYDECLIQEQLRRLDGTIDRFLEGFADRIDRLGEAQRTLIFLPGGMGSELARADSAFAGNCPPNGFTYDTLWYDFFLISIFGYAVDLRMAGNVDLDQRMILADGPMRNCAYSPYGRFEEWCEDNDLDVLPLGWDWRRSPTWNVRFFLDHFIPYVRARAASFGFDPAVDPLTRTSLIGHSFGGMLVKWILNDAGHPFCQALQLGVTVGAPFYGYPGHLHRFFEGEPLIGESTYDPAELSEVIATMPGGYALLYLDGGTYDAFRPALEADAYPLMSYPCVDADDPSLRADPYNPGLRGPGELRYPAWVSPVLLNDGLGDYQALAKPLAASVKDKLHCFRGVQFGGGVALKETRSLQRWSWIDRLYDPPHSVSPVLERAADNAPGDGTIPAWSARLVTQDLDHIHTIEEDLEHTALMDNRTIRSTLLQLLRPGAHMVMLQYRAAPASKEELDTFKKGLEDIVRNNPDKKVALAAAHAYIKPITFRRRRALFQRWLIELSKGPPGRRQ